MKGDSVKAGPFIREGWGFYKKNPTYYIGTHLLCSLGVTMQFRENPLNCIMANFKFAKEYLCRYAWAVISVCHCRD